MKARTLPAVSLLMLLLAFPACDPMTRSAGPPDDDTEGAAAFDRTMSAGLFVGINRFDDKTLSRVAYAVDDAVDLAWHFALDRRIALLSPTRVVLAISGVPHKKESKQRLEELKRAGAVVRRATRDDIAALINQQAAAAGKSGLFIAAFASHGYSKDGVPYVLASSSIFGIPETALSTAKVFDIAVEAGAKRSLIFLDACRERLSSSPRFGPDPESAAAFLDDMGTADGQAVFYAAATGKYAYDDPKRRNGVFSAAVLDGLQCGAETNAHGFVTVETLSVYVEKRVRNWLMVNRPRTTGSATQTNMDGATKDMPLVQCRQPLSLASMSSDPAARYTGKVHPDHVEIDDTSIEAFGKDNVSLWRKEVRGRITRAEAVDLNADGAREVVVSVGSEGEDSGRIIVFNPAGEDWWHSPGGATLGVTFFMTADLFRDKRQEIIAIFTAQNGSSGSRLTIFRPDGQVYGVYPYPGRLQSVAMGKETSHHWPRLAVWGIDDDLHAQLDERGPLANVFLLNPLKLGKPLWSGALVPSSRIDKLEIVDFDNDSKRDIAITTGGGKIHLDFAGEVLSSDAEAKFVRIGKEETRQATIRR